MPRGSIRSIPTAKAMADGLLVYAANGEDLRPSQGYPLRLAAPRLRGEHEHQVAAPPQDRHGTLAHAVGHPLLRRSDARWDGARVHLRHGSQVGHHVALRRATPARTRLRRDHAVWPGRDEDGSPGRRLHRRRADAGPRRRCRSRCCRWPGPASASPGSGTASRPSSRAGPSTRPATCSRRMAQLVEARGVNSFYHNNAIKTWAIAADGEVSNVYA